MTVLSNLLRARTLVTRVKTQTKGLAVNTNNNFTGNISGTTGNSDFKFSNLVIGQRYRVSCNLEVEHDGTGGSQDRLMFANILNGAAKLAEMKIRTETLTRHEPTVFASREFVATDTGIEINVSSHNFLIIVGDPNSSYLQLEHLPDNLYEATTDFT